MIKYIKRIYRYTCAWMKYRPPSSLTSVGWRLFEKEFKSVAPVRYWITHTLKYSVLMPIKWKYDNISLWVSHRTTSRYHIMDTGLPPGYYNISEQILHASFNSLKDFVEVDLALREHWCSKSKKSWCEKHMPFYRIVYPFRNPLLGITHLEWEMTLDDPTLPAYERSPEQAKHAREVMALYKWWTETRPARIEPIIRYPSNDFFDIFDPIFRNSQEYKLYRSDIKKSTKIKASWDKEDDAMLIRLMKIRHGLWA